MPTLAASLKKPNVWIYENFITVEKTCCDANTGTLTEGKKRMSRHGHIIREETFQTSNQLNQYLYDI